MKPALRKPFLTLHIMFSVGWLGAVVAYLVPAVTALTTPDDALARSLYVAMALIATHVIVPLAIGTLITGLIHSLGSEWGLFRHYWVVTKFLLTLLGIAVLLGHLPRILEMASATSLDNSMLRSGLVIHAAGGIAVLSIATVLSVFKPWGKTRFR